MKTEKTIKTEEVKIQSLHTHHTVVLEIATQQLVEVHILYGGHDLERKQDIRKSKGNQQTKNKMKMQPPISLYRACRVSAHPLNVSAKPSPEAKANNKN